jgi:hypothetical protein
MGLASARAAYTGAACTHRRRSAALAWTVVAKFAPRHKNKRYWLHVAIDRFTGEVIDQQLEAVDE